MDVEIVLLGRPIRIAEGVRMGEVNWYLTCIIKTYQDVCEQQRVIGCITGGTDEPPGIVEADHKDNRALDLRSSVFLKPEIVARELSTRLSYYSTRFVVKYLDVGYGKHFHVAWR